MARTLNTRTKYKIIGSDYSSQEPRLTSFVSQDDNMIQAFEEKKDLYAIIAQSAFNNNYEDNLEFLPTGTAVETDGRKIISGDDAPDVEIEVDTEQPLALKAYNILELADGNEVQVHALKSGNTLANGLVIDTVSVNNLDVIITFKN